MVRKPLIAANWKMHASPAGALSHESPYQPHAAVDVIVFPTFLDIRACVAAGIIAGGQWGHPEASGARTGDVSMALLAAAGCRYVLCGHSERRIGHRETDADVAAQAVAALEARLHPVVCIGETAEQRDRGGAKEVIRRQLRGLPLESDLTIAYEPVWAIGTGVTATPEQAEEMHAYIREHLPPDRRDATRILYGGSVKAANAADLLRCPDIDGALVGGSSLSAEEFRSIIDAAMTGGNP